MYSYEFVLSLTKITHSQEKYKRNQCRLHLVFQLTVKLQTFSKLDRQLPPGRARLGQFYVCVDIM